MGVTAGDISLWFACADCGFTTGIYALGQAAAEANICALVATQNGRCSAC